MAHDQLIAPFFPALARRAGNIPWLIEIPGFVLLFICYEISAYLQLSLHFLVPASIVGMLGLLVLLKLNIIPEKLVAPTDKRVRSLLPALFVPLYVKILFDPAFWTHSGVLIILSAGTGAALTLIVTAKFAVWNAK